MSHTNPLPELTDEQITVAAMSAGFALSTAYGQSTTKLMPVSDRATLIAFARAIEHLARSTAAQPVEPTVLPSEALYGFAGWLTCRPGTVVAGSCHDAGVWAELVVEYIRSQGFEEPRDDIYPDNLKPGPRAAASGDSTPPSEPVTDGMVAAFTSFAKKATHLHHPDVPYLGVFYGDSEEEWQSRVIKAALTVALNARVQGDPSGALRPEPESTEPDCHGLDTRGRVRFYEHDFYVLSNFSAFRLRWAGMEFDTSEHAYHWAKFGTQPDGEAVGMWVEREPFANGVKWAPSAHAAFKFAEQHKARCRPDWDDVKVDIMRDILRAKAQQHEYVRRKLLATGDRYLVEDSWRDDFWGWGPNRDGKNMLGRLWMEVRAEFRAAEPSQAASGSRGD